jgi:antitoxin YefM
VNPFGSNLKTYVKHTINEHGSMKVTRRAGEDFMDMSVNDSEREQQTLHVLQSNHLMQNITKSIGTQGSSRCIGKMPSAFIINNLPNLGDINNKQTSALVGVM